MSNLWAGVVAPEVFDLQITSPAGGLDLTTVTAATIEVYLPGGTTASWSASLVGATTTSLTVRHSFASGTSDVPAAGSLFAYAHLTVPGGFVDTPRVEQRVRAKWEAQ